MRRLATLSGTLFVRWSLAIATGFAMMALILFAFIYWQTAVHEKARIDGIILHELKTLTAAPPETVAGALEVWLAADVHDVVYGGIFAPEGAHLAGNLLKRPDGLRFNGEPARAVFGPIGRDRDGDDPETVRGVGTTLADGRQLVIGYDVDELEEVDDIIVRALSLSLVPMVVLSLTGGMLLTLRAQRRIGDVHVAVDRIMGGALRERLPVSGTGDELDKVSVAVNRMLDRMERLIDEIRGVGDSMAHDLRTPLTRVRTRLERSRDEATTREEFQRAADRAIASVDQALAVVSAVLRIGEIEHGRRRSAFAPTDLSGVLQDVAELYAPIAEERGVTLGVRAAAGLVVAGDRDLLIEAIGNLVDNAIKFAPAHTVVQLALDRRGGGAVVGVADRGCGIPAEERDRVLQRFYRTEKSRTVAGSGLGLSLVAAVATLHGFRLRLGDAGPGCMAELICPDLLETSPAPPVAAGVKV